jgi:hypothetical protein
MKDMCQPLDHNAQCRVGGLGEVGRGHTEESQERVDTDIRGKDAKGLEKALL